MNTDIVWGGLLVLDTAYVTIQRYITKKNVEDTDHDRIFC